MRLFAGALFLAAAASAAGGEVAAKAMEPVAVSPAGQGAFAPSLASAGHRTVLAWAGRMASGETAIHSLVLRDATIGGRLPTGRVLDVLPAGDTPELQAGVNPATLEAAVAWVRTGDTLLFREGRRPFEVAAITTERIEFPSLAYDASGAAYLAWSELSGGVSRLHAAVRPAGGTWTAIPVAADARPYDLMPQVFGRDAGADLFWYSVEGDGFRARRALLPGGGEMFAGSRTLSELPANRLPVLYRSGAADVAAFWMEPGAQGDEFVSLRPGGDAQRMAVREMAASRSGPGVRAWIAPGDGKSATVNVDTPWSAGTIATAASSAAREPAVSASDNFVHAAWVEDPALGGDGRLRYWRTR